jgi:purine-binding chemotaxis protein CheW
METKSHSTLGKYLTFRLGGEEYGIEILKVREIIGLLEATPVPQAAAYVRGVVNLRGKIVPVIDLRKKFGLPEAPPARDNCVITVMYEGKEGDLLVGLQVDKVMEVVKVSAAEIEPLPVLGEDLKVDFLLGLAKTKERIVVLLDVDKVVQEQDFRALFALNLGKA